MGLKEELGFPHPVTLENHEAILGVMITAALFAKEADKLLKPYGLTDSQFNVMMLLAYQSDDGSLDQTTLGRMLVVNRSNVTGLVDRMERAGLVERGASPEDRRVKLVHLTPRGAGLLERAYESYAARLREVANPLSEPEKKHLKSSLEKMRLVLRNTEKAD